MIQWKTRKGCYFLDGLSRVEVSCSTKLGFPEVEDWISLSQVHSAIVHSGVPEQGTPGDGWLLSEAGPVASVKVADCCPVFLIDDQRPVVAGVHAGWRGALLGVHLNALKLMRQLHGSKPQEVLVAVGPCICGQCYEVGKEVASLFPGFAVERKHGWFLDIFGFIAWSLREAGVLPENIIGPPACTYESLELWSARRDGYAGRIWCFARLRQWRSWV